MNRFRTKRWSFVAPWRIVVVAAGLVAASVAAAAPSSASPPPTIEQLGLPAATGRPAQFVTGADGNLWVTERPSNRLARMTPGGTSTEIALPGESSLVGLAAGSDGNVWAIGDRVHRVSPSGVVTSFAMPPGTCCPGRAATGADGNVWFINGLQQVGRVTPAGVVTLFPMPPAGPFDTPWAIAAGPDGNVWYTRGGRLGRVTPTGVIAEFPTPEGSALELTAGPDGSVWYSTTGGHLGRMGPDGSAAPPVPLADVYSTVEALGVGPGGAVWMVYQQPFYEAQEFVSHIDASGARVDFAIPQSRSNEFATVEAIGMGPDTDAVWFLMASRQALGRLELHPATKTTVTTSASPVNQGESVTLGIRVEAPFGNGTPTGSVVLRDNGVPLGSPLTLAGGQASVTVTLPPGSHIIKADYSGDGPFRSSQSAGIGQLVRLGIRIDARPVLAGVNLANTSLWLPEPVLLVADLYRTDGAPFVLAGTPVRMVDASGQTICVVETTRDQPSRAECDITFAPVALARVVAGLGFTAVFDQTQLMTGTQDHAGLVEVTTS